MSTPTERPPIKTTLIDVTNCIGCRACQVACKQWNEREGESTELLPQLGYQNPATLSAKTYTLISFHETPLEKAPEGMNYSFVMRRCFHCLEPACVSACPTTALHTQPDGPVSYDASKCIGCHLCVVACDDGAHQCIHPPPAGQAGGVEPASRVPVIDESECVGCNLCKIVCPVPDCITMEKVDNGYARASWNEHVGEGKALRPKKAAH